MHDEPTQRTRGLPGRALNGELKVHEGEVVFLRRLHYAGGLI